MRKSREQYTGIAAIYDALNADVDYNEIADFLIDKTTKYYKKPDMILDLACGTGKLSAVFAKQGFDTTGVDLSEDMLLVASERARKQKLDILYLCQDMCKLDLYGTYDAVYCMFDSLNYLTKSGELSRCFSLVHNYLNPDGIFIFDINTPYKFENIYADNSYILEADGIFCAWQNFYNKKSKMCDFYLTFFEEDSNGKYNRFEEAQRERCYSENTILKALKDNNLELLEIVGEDRVSLPADNDGRRYYIARAKK